MRALFYYNNDNNLECLLTDKDKRIVIKSRRQINKILHELNNSRVTNFKYYEDTLKIMVDGSPVVIKSFSKFVNHNDIDYLPKLKEKLIANTELKQVTKNAKKKVTRFVNSMPGKTVIAGGLALFIITQKVPGLAYSNNDTKTSDTSIETIEEENNVTPIYLTNGSKVEINETTTEISEGVEVKPLNVTTNYIDASTVTPTTQESNDIVDCGNATISIKSDRDESNYENAYNNYYELVEKYAKKWGVSPNLPLAMLTQESGGRVNNLMQIQFASWANQKMTLYNYEENRYQTFLFSNTATSTNDVTVISSKDLQNPATNISIGIAIYRYGLDLEITGNNPFLACIMYNQGIGNTYKILKAASNATGVPIFEMQNNPSNTTFIDYVYVTGVGDRNYLQNCFKYLREYNGEMSISFKTHDGDEITENKIGVTIKH